MNIEALTTMGVCIWWSEGTKSRRDVRWARAVSYPIEVTNTNPQIIRIFLLFLRTVIKAPEHNIKLQVQIHEGDDQDCLEQYWSDITAIPKNRFNKTIIRPTGKKIGKSLGTCKVRFSDKQTYLLLESLLTVELAKVGISKHGILTTGTRVVDLLE